MARQRGRLNFEAQPRRKAHRAQQAQAILGEARRRVADGADDLRFEVRPATHKIEHPTPALIRQRIQEHPVHGEVAPGGVLLGRGEMDALGPPAIKVSTVRAEGGNLQVLSTLPHQDHAEVCSHDIVARKQRLHLLRAGIRGDVIILRLAAQENIPHAAASVIRRESPGTQPLHHPAGDRFQGEGRRHGETIIPADQKARPVRKKNSAKL